jgi:apolipoprotein N-acyltransferase
MTAPARSRGRFLSDVLLCILAGVATFAAFPTALAPEWSFWPLIWLSHVPLLWVLRDKSPKAAFGWGSFCGTIINVGGYYWIAGLLERFGHLPTPVAVLGLVLHSVYQGVIWGLWAWFINRIGNTTRVPVQWSAPAVMVGLELAVPRLFPAYMGNSQFPFLPVMQIADLVGIYGVTFLLYRVNANGYLWLRSLVEGRPRPWRATAMTAALVGGSLVYGMVRIHQLDGRVAEAPKLKVGLVEGDVGIFEREPREKRENHLLVQQQLSAKLEQQGAELIIWPESSYRRGYLPRHAKRFPPSKAPLVANDRVDDEQDTSTRDRNAPIRGFDTPLLFGAVSVQDREKLRFDGDLPMEAFNSAWLLDADGTVVDLYDKVYLLLFGEYIPFAEYMPWIYKAIPAAGNLDAGDDPEVITGDLWGKGPVRIGTLICYEGILPAFTRQVGVQSPHFIANLTNDDWFGITAERYLHLALTIPRAIEHRVAFARGTLTGVSAFIDPVGRLVSQTSPYGAETLLWDVPLLQSRTVYQVIGDSFAWGCLAFTLGAYGWGRWRRRRA